MSKRTESYIKQNIQPAEFAHSYKDKNGNLITLTQTQIDAERQSRLNHNARVMKEAERIGREERLAEQANDDNINAAMGSGRPKVAGNDEPVYGLDKKPSIILAWLEFVGLVGLALLAASAFGWLLAQALFYFRG